MAVGGFKTSTFLCSQVIIDVILTTQSRGNSEVHLLAQNYSIPHGLYNLLLHLRFHPIS